MDYKVIKYQKEVLEKGKIKNLNLLHGEEEFLIKTLLENLKKVFGENLNVVWGDELELGNLYELASEGSIFSGSREKALVVLKFEEFLRKLGKKKKDMEALLELLKKLRNTKFFAVVGRKLSAQELAKEPFKTIASLGDVITADRLPQAKVKDIVRKKLEREAGGIEEDALELLTRMCGYNLMILKQESEKLVAYAEGRRIGVEDVRKVCFPWEDYAIFELIDSFFSRDLEKTLRVLRDSYRKGISPLQILGMLSTYISRLYIVHNLLSLGDPLDRALDKVGVKHSFAKLKFKEYLENTPEERAKKLLEDLFRLDYAVKVLFEEPQKALANFITEHASPQLSF
jgi:DNA polymerase-3 subunit delta